MIVNDYFDDAYYVKKEETSIALDRGDAMFVRVSNTEKPVASPKQSWNACKNFTSIIIVSIHVYIILIYCVRIKYIPIIQVYKIK